MSIYGISVMKEFCYFLEITPRDDHITFETWRRRGGGRYQLIQIEQITNQPLVGRYKESVLFRIAVIVVLIPQAMNGMSTLHSPSIISSHNPDSLIYLVMRRKQKQKQKKRNLVKALGWTRAHCSHVQSPTMLKEVKGPDKLTSIVQRSCSSIAS